MATQDILINWSPQETRVAVVENGAVQELHIERTLERGLVGNVYLGKVARVLPGMQSAFVDIGLERAAFLHVADLHGGRRRARDGDAPAGADRTPGVRRPDADGAGHQGPDRHQGRAAVDPGQRSPGACWSSCRRTTTSASRRRSAAPELREQLRARMQLLAGGTGPRTATGRRLHPAHQRRGSERRRAGRRHRLPAQGLGPIRERALRSPAGTLLHQDLNLAERVLRDLINETTQTIRIDSQAAVRGPARPSASTYMPGAVAKLEHYQGERPIFDLFGIEEEITPRAGTAGRPEERRLPDHRPDRGADHDRRQHRRLRRRAQLRRHDLQDQPRGRRRHRPPAAAAQPGRHHHRRLHRHDARGPPAGGARRVHASSSRATARARRSAASRSWAWWR